MKVIAYEACKVVMLFPLEEVIPLSGAGDPDVLDKIKQRYRFANGPNLNTDEIAKNGYKFELGSFQFDSSSARIINFALYRDGIVINAIKTDAAEAFLDDIISYMKDEFKFRDFITAPRRYFQSQIIVEFERSPARLIKFLSEITDTISTRLQETYGMEIRMEFARIDFDCDRSTNRVPALIQKFIIERRLGTSFENERYYCAAPLRTPDHEAVLREIESLVG